MIFLDTPTRSLAVVLAGAKNTNDCPVTVAYIDEPATTTGTSVAVGGTQVATTNGVTVTTICSAPGAGPGFRRRITAINLQVADLAAITVSIQIVDTTGSVTTVLQKYTLQTLEQLNYEQGYGFSALDANGAQKSQAAATSSAASTADSKAVSAGSQASVADSKAVSDSVLTSTAQSTATSGGLAASVALSTASSAGTAASVADSKAVSDSVTGSTAQSTAGSAGTAASVASSAAASGSTGASTAVSTLTSRVSSKGG